MFVVSPPPASAPLHAEDVVFLRQPGRAAAAALVTPEPEVPWTGAMRCIVQPSGALDGCTVVTETPLGFGLAARAAAYLKDAQVAPLARDGRPTAGRALVMDVFVAPSRTASGSAPLLWVDGWIATEAMIDGHGPFRFVVDTGAEASEISPRLVRTLALQPAPGKLQHLQGASGAADVPLYRVGAFGSGLFQRAGAFLDRGAHEDASDGVIGADAFSGGRIAFDFALGRIEAGPSSPPPPGFAALPFELSQGHRQVRFPVVIDGVAATALLDTGARRSTGDLALQKALGLVAGDPRLKPSPALHGSAGGALPAVTAHIGHIEAAGARFSDLEVAFADLPDVAPGVSGPLLVVGADLLSRFAAVAVDYPRRELQVRLKRPAEWDTAAR